MVGGGIDDEKGSQFVLYGTAVHEKINFLYTGAMYSPMLYATLA
jgi:hypothetical protein